MTRKKPKPRALIPRQQTQLLPHSWTIDSWPPHVFPNSVTKARYIIRMHKNELILCGALSRVGRDLIVMGDGFSRWMQKMSARVPNFGGGGAVAANRERQAADGAA